jgi:lipopolysaccharide biosynthesis glycosyltransferase
VFCDIDYLQYVEYLQFDYIVVTEKNNTPVQASMRKVEIFDFDMIHHFEKVIYLDSDIVVLGDINIIFDQMNDPNTLYTFNESDDFNEHNLIYFGKRDYSAEQMNEFVRRNVKVFNCGQFGFLVSEQMRSHFTNIRNMIKSNKDEHFYEQSFMNYYFNTRFLTNPIFNTYTILPTRLDKVKPSTIIAHFANTNIPVMQKLAMMKTFYYS